MIQLFHTLVTFFLAQNMVVKISQLIKKKKRNQHPVEVITRTKNKLQISNYFIKDILFTVQRDEAMNCMLILKKERIASLI